MVQRSRFNFMREAQIWYSRDSRPANAVGGVRKRDRAQRRVLRGDHRSPGSNDLEPVKVLAAAPAVLDLFMWLTYRCFIAKGTETIPVLGPYGLATQIGSVEYSRERRFVAKLEQWLRPVRVMRPGCPARICRRTRARARSRGRDLAVTFVSAVCNASSCVTSCNRRSDERSIVLIRAAGREPVEAVPDGALDLMRRGVGSADQEISQAVLAEEFAGRVGALDHAVSEKK